MSTLTSAQLCVKRSSTRLHAPPGGHSSLSFGPGGFGTTDTASPPVVGTAPGSRGGSTVDYYAVTPPASRGDDSRASYASLSTSNYPPPPTANYPPPPTANYAPLSTTSYAPHSAADYSPLHAAGYGAPSTASYGAPSTAGYPPSSAGGGRVPSRWGEQPPLTASRRDQNWERKRRQWLARRRTPGACEPEAFEASGPFEEPAGPASPLSKFMRQHADRLPTAAGAAADAAVAYALPPRPASSRADAALALAHARTPTPPPSGGSRQPPGGRASWSPFM